MHAPVTIGGGIQQHWHWLAMIILILERSSVTPAAPRVNGRRGGNCRICWKADAIRNAVVLNFNIFFCFCF